MEAHVRSRFEAARRHASLGQKVEALGVLRDMLRLKASGAFWGGVAQQLYALGDLEAAGQAARKYHASAPGDGKAALMLAMILGDAGKIREALPLASRAAKSNASDAAAKYGLGLLLARDNRFDAALKQFRNAVDLQPEHAEALEYIAYLGPAETAHRDLEAVERALAAGGHAGQVGAAILNYAKATLLERAGDLEAAFCAYARGAELMRTAPDLDAMQRYVGRLRNSFNGEFFERHREHACANKLPIFIVGVPRSGTTLVETALAAHPQVSSAGESTLLRLATMRYGSFEPPDLVRIETAVDRGGNPWDEMGRDLRKSYAARVGRGRRLTEKNLGHHFLLGVTSLIARGAPIVYCVRDPAATAWSCFKTRFASGNEWSYDFESITRYQRLYADLMEHWRSVLPAGSILDVRYEDLVARPDEIIPEVLSHAGLKFNAACLRPQDARTPVRTASMAQVRQPIHTNAVGGWRRFETWLADKHEVFRARNSG